MYDNILIMIEGEQDIQIYILAKGALDVSHLSYV